MEIQDELEEKEITGNNALRKSFVSNFGVEAEAEATPYSAGPRIVV